MIFDVTGDAPGALDRVIEDAYPDDTDWRTPIIEHLKDPNHRVDQQVHHLAFKFTFLNDELYRRTTEDLLLKCIDDDQAKVAMGEVHEGICGMHQLPPKIKWLLRRAGFYWPTMIANYFRYYKGYEECQNFGNIQMVSAATLHPIIKQW